MLFLILIGRTVWLNQEAVEVAVGGSRVELDEFQRWALARKSARAPELTNVEVEHTTSRAKIGLDAEGIHHLYEIDQTVASV